MIGGILVDKKTRRKVLGFKRVEEYSVDEIIENNGLDPDKLEFVDNADLDQDVSEIRHFHKIHSNGSTEDTRGIIGYRYRLGKKHKVAGEEVATDREPVTFKKELPPEAEKALEKSAGKKILGKEPILG